MSDMIEVFKDTSILAAQLKVKIVNAREEARTDENGVFRDAMSAFWTTFENSCTVGEDEGIPVIGYDFQAPEWEAIARLLVKGFRQLNFFPVNLNRAFLIATIFGEREVTEKVLLDSFLAYLSRDERALVVDALNGTLEDEHIDEWLDFLDRFGCKRVPKPEQCRDTILEIVHNEQIQACQYIIDCWHEYGTLFNLLDNYIPLVLAIYSISFKLNHFSECFRAMIRIWIMFTCLKCRHYNKAPLVWINMCVHWGKHSTNLYQLLRNYIAIFDEYPVENTHSILRAQSKPSDTAEQLRKKAKQIFQSKEQQANFRSHFTSSFLLEKSSLSYLTF